MKKLISCILVIAMAFSLVCGSFVTAYADDEPVIEEEAIVSEETPAGEPDGEPAEAPEDGEPAEEEEALPADGDALPADEEEESVQNGDAVEGLTAVTALADGGSYGIAFTVGETTYYIAADATAVTDASQAAVWTYDASTKYLRSGDSYLSHNKTNLTTSASKGGEVSYSGTTFTMKASGANRNISGVDGTTINVVKDAAFNVTVYEVASAAFTWAEDYSSATATLDETTVDATVEQTGSTEATCVKAATVTYTATAVIGEETFTESKTVDVGEALSHVYGTPEYKWADDLSACTAAATCTVCEGSLKGGTVTEEGTVTSAISQNEAGAYIKTFTAVFTNELFAEQTETKEFNIDKADYKIGKPTFEEDAEGNRTYSITATYIGTEEKSDDEKVITDTAVAVREVLKAETCTDVGYCGYTVTWPNYGGILFDEVYKDYAVIPAHGHHYGEAEYTWDKVKLDEYGKFPEVVNVTGTVVCVDGDDTITETVSALKLSALVDENAEGQPEFEATYKSTAFSEANAKYFTAQLATLTAEGEEVGPVPGTGAAYTYTAEQIKPGYLYVLVIEVGGKTYAISNEAKAVPVAVVDGVVKTDDASITWAGGESGGGPSGVYSLYNAAAGGYLKYGSPIAVSSSGGGAKGWSYDGSKLTFDDRGSSYVVTGMTADGYAESVKGGTPCTAALYIGAETDVTGGSGGGGSEPKPDDSGSSSSADLITVQPVATRWIDLSKITEENPAANPAYSIVAEVPAEEGNDCTYDLTFTWTFNGTTVTDTVTAAQAVEGKYTSSFTADVSALVADKKVGVYPVTCKVSYNHPQFDETITETVVRNFNIPYGETLPEDHEDENDDCTVTYTYVIDPIVVQGDVMGGAGLALDHYAIEETRVTVWNNTYFAANPGTDGKTENVLDGETVIGTKVWSVKDSTSAPSADAHTVNVIIANGAVQNSLLTFSDIHEGWDDLGTAINNVITAHDGFIPAMIIASGDFNNSYLTGSDGLYYNEDYPDDPKFAVDQATYDAYVRTCVDDIIKRIALQVAGIDTVWVSGNHDNGYAAAYMNWNEAANLGIDMNEYVRVDEQVQDILGGTGNITGTGIIFDTRTEAFAENADSSQVIGTYDEDGAYEGGGLVVIGMNFEDNMSLYGKTGIVGASRNNYSGTCDYGDGNPIEYEAPVQKVDEQTGEPLFDEQTGEPVYVQLTDEQTGEPLFDEKDEPVYLTETKTIETEATQYCAVRDALQSIAENYNGELVVISSHCGAHVLGLDPSSSCSSEWDGSGDYNITNSAAMVHMINSFVEEYGMNIMWLMGHDHSKGEDPFIKLPGDTIISCVSFSDKTYEEITLKFVYGHSGYIGHGAAGLSASTNKYSFIEWDGDVISRDMLYVNQSATVTEDTALSFDLSRTYVNVKVVPQKTVKASVLSTITENTENTLKFDSDDARAFNVYAVDSDGFEVEEAEFVGGVVVNLPLPEEVLAKRAAGQEYSYAVFHLNDDGSVKEVISGANVIENMEGVSVTVSSLSPFVLVYHSHEDHYTSEVTTEPTCVAGVKTYTCSVDGETKTEVLSAIAEHTYGDPVAAVEPTATTEGHVAYYQCSVCGKYFEVVEIEPEEEGGEVTYQPGAELTTVTIPALGYKLGDIDGDDEITSKDALYAALLANGSYTEDTEVVKNFAGADVDKSGDITAKDALWISLYANGTEKFVSERIVSA